MEKEKESSRFLKTFQANDGPYILMAILPILIFVGVISLISLLNQRTRFHDVTVELGAESINISSFMNEKLNIKYAEIVSDLSDVDISKVGSTKLVMAYKGREETVTLTVQDTTPPEAKFVQHLEKTPDYQPDAKDFVESYSDFSKVDIRFAGSVVVPLDYSDQKVSVIVEDEYGNAVTGECTFSIVWLKEDYDLELGETLTKEDILYNPERDSNFINQVEIDKINDAMAVGDYKVASVSGQESCQIHVKDTTPPELELKDVSVFVKEKVKMENFIESCFDASGDVDLELKSELITDEIGIQTITIEAKDIYGNVATKTATLAVVKDKKPPVFKGLTPLMVAKGVKPNYVSGVKATDKIDGECEFSYDDRGVNLNVAGTYYVTYTAQDKSGNTARVKRTIMVGHDLADTKVLADTIAAGLNTTDPEAIRDYVRNNIKYIHNDGGADPTWYGFTEWKGDCRVHAYCLQALLERKGYETQMIWVTDKSHYWLIINLNGTWRHIDATPGSRHTKYSLMTDEERYSILQGRDWDRTAWPACE